jgi:hypothetical protein
MLREERIDHFTLVVRCVRPSERAQEAVEIGDRVVAKKARAIPDGSCLEFAPLVNHH